MSLTTAALNEACNAIQIDTIKLHNGDAGDGTANVIAGTTKAISMGAAVNGVRSIAGEVTIDVSGVTVSHYSLWNGSTLKAKKAFPTPETFNGAGKANIKTATLTVQNVT